MNNSELSYKLKYILKELGLNKTELLEECRKYNPSLSKPTLLNAINGKNKNTPSIDTLSAIINVCKMSGNPKLKYISFDFLLNQNIQEIEAKNVTIYQEIGLSDEVISRLKQFNHPLYFGYGNIINSFFAHTSGKYWEYLQQYKWTVDIITLLNKENVDVKTILKLFNDDLYLLMLKNNFKNVYEIYLKLDSTKDIKQVDINEFISKLAVIKKYYKMLLLELNEQFYNDI